MLERVLIFGGCLYSGYWGACVWKFMVFVKRKELFTNKPSIQLKHNSIEVLSSPLTKMTSSLETSSALI